MVFNSVSNRSDVNEERNQVVNSILSYGYFKQIEGLLSGQKWSLSFCLSQSKILAIENVGFGKDSREKEDCP